MVNGTVMTVDIQNVQIQNATKRQEEMENIVLLLVQEDIGLY